MAKNNFDNKIVRLELDPKSPCGPMLEFDSEESRQHYRENPDELIVLLHSFLAGLCMNLGDDISESKMYVATVISDFKKSLSLFKK